MNPFSNPYTQNPYIQQPTIQPTQVVKVNGRNGAMQYAMGPNSSAWILDENGLISWLCTTDGAGYKTVTAYDIAPHKEETASDYSSLETRIKRLEDAINANAGNTATNSKSKSRPESGQADNKHD